MSAKLSLAVETRLEELDRLSASVEDFAREQGWPTDLTFQVNLVLEELWLNVVNYGHDSGEHVVMIELTSATESLTIEITDDGKPFNPLENAPIPDVTAALDDRSIGGLGVHLVLTMMDESRYTREGGKNHLILVKRRTE